ncbi:MAG: FecR domain-containing protein [Chitinophagaceae bacterium]|nr:FecR domain-containing protein [Chitinophagaceae bacterium]
MTREEKEYKLLLQRWMRNQVSVEEADALMRYLDKGDHTRTLLQELRESFDAAQFLETPMDEALSERVRKKLLEHTYCQPVIGMQPRDRGRGWFRMIAAAVAAISIGLGAYFFFFNKPLIKDPAPSAVLADTANDAAPGQYRALLTLADGKQITLDQASVGELAREGGAAIVNKGGQLEYSREASVGEQVAYNTVSTARGESYPLVLSDGTRVWLNASSSVRFPTSFTGNERRIEISGEAYFEVAKDPSKPFRVGVRNMTVEALGTSFDINAYTDESTINTTLVEGAVKVYSGNAVLRLAPGQQSRLLAEGRLQLEDKVNIDEIIAWKDGLFHFERADLASILRQFSRWYAVDIVYEGKVKPRRFFGIISRGSSLSDVLKMLEANDIRFKIEGKKLIVQSG